MEFFQTTQLAVPLIQCMLLLLLSTVLLLIGRAKLALLLDYIFLLYWSYVLNAELFDSLEKAGTYKSIYLGFGIVIVILVVVGFFAHAN